MGRTKKTESDEEVNAAIGARVSTLRGEKGWSLTELAKHLGLSIAHINALESGKYSYSPTLLLKLAKIFNVSIDALLGANPPADELPRQWQQLFEALSRRDRAVLMDLARKMASWSETFMLKAARQASRGQGYLVSLEGIDGALLRELGDSFAKKTRKRGEREVAHCSYDFDSSLWRYLMSRFEELESSSHVGSSSHEVFERTLLFACERLHRQETSVRPMLIQDKTVLTPFFTMAPSVYQEMEGVGDLRLIDIVESLLLQPDLIIVVLSDPAVAARKAVRRRPKSGEFYSPYTEAEFARAQKIYEKTAQDFDARGYSVRILSAEGGAVSDDLLAQLDRMASPVAQGSA